MNINIGSSVMCRDNKLYDIVKRNADNTVIGLCRRKSGSQRLFHRDGKYAGSDRLKDAIISSQYGGRK